MYAKITAYNNDKATNDCSDFSMNMFWGDDYRNEFYLCGDLGRSTFEDIVETTTDATGQSKRIQNTSIERFNLSAVITTPLLQFLKTIDKCDNKILTFLDTGDSYVITNIDIEDSGDNLTPSNLVNIIFEDEPITRISDAVYVDSQNKLAFWDNDNDGVKDLNGEAEYQSGLDFFQSWQLYYESDGITPTASGDVSMFVYGTRDGVESLLGIFRGVFGNSFSDSTKWQTTQSLHLYFSGTVGHTNVVTFNKRAFAEDNGYLSDEEEDRAVNIRLDLAIDGSDRESTTCALVYSVLGGFHQAKITNGSTFEYGYITLGKTDEKNTIDTIQDVRQDTGSGASTLVSSPVSSSLSNFSQLYTLAIAPSATEFYYVGAFSTNGGYEAENGRGSLDASSFALSPDGIAPISQQQNILNFTVGATPFDINITWRYLYEVGVPYAVGSFPNLGALTANGAAYIYLDGVLITNLPTILTTSQDVTGTNTITLPDTDVHTIKFTLTTNNGYEIYSEFEVQLRALF